MAQSILAVDDEPHMLVLLERILRERTPYEIVTTSSALEVPRLLEDREFNVIVCDVKMPGMSGLDVLRKIREEKRPELVILITAFSTTETAEESLELGVFDYLSKPFKKEQLLNAIERAMDWQQRQADNPTADPIVDRDPFEFASDVFRTAWIRHLANQTGEDIADLARRTNLSEREITAALASRAKPG